MIRLHPREDGSQRWPQQQLSILPTPAGRAQQLDSDGNVALQVWFDGPTTGLSVLSSFTAETLRENPFDFLLPSAEQLGLPMKYPETLGPALAHYANGSRVDDAVHAFAEARSAEAGWQAMPFLMNLTETLCRDWKHVLRPEGASYAPAVTLQLGEGSCRDLAALFSEACRAMGFAARFVSGYERAAAVEQHAYMHAWAEVYIPGGGWRAYDPRAEWRSPPPTWPWPRRPIRRWRRRSRDCTAARRGRRCRWRLRCKWGSEGIHSLGRGVMRPIGGGATGLAAPGGHFAGLGDVP